MILKRIYGAGQARIPDASAFCPDRDPGSHHQKNENTRSFSNFQNWENFEEIIFDFFFGFQIGLSQETYFFETATFLTKCRSKRLP